MPQSQNYIQINEAIEAPKWERILKQMITVTSRDLAHNYVDIYSRLRNTRGSAPDFSELSRLTPQEKIKKIVSLCFNKLTIQEYTGLNDKDLSFRKEQPEAIIEIRAEYKREGDPVNLSTILKSEWTEKHLVPRPVIKKRADGIDLYNLTDMVNLGVLGVEAQILAKYLEQNFAWDYLQKGVPFDGTFNMKHKFHRDDVELQINVPTRVIIEKSNKVRLKVIFDGKTWK
ncbi:hypothetical protein HY837_05315 [archaeon]|nr:hypothetical protein [archaeon]